MMSGRRCKRSAWLSLLVSIQIHLDVIKNLFYTFLNVFITNIFSSICNLVIVEQVRLFEFNK